MSRMSKNSLYEAYGQPHHAGRHRAGPAGAAHAGEKFLKDALPAVATAGLSGYYQGSNNGMPEIGGIGYDALGGALLWGAGAFFGDKMGKTDTGGRVTESAGLGLLCAASASFGAVKGCESRAANHLAPCGAPQAPGAAVNPLPGAFSMPAPSPAMPAPPPAGAHTGGWTHQGLHLRY